MLDKPDGKAILRAVQAALKTGIAPGFQQVVAANAVALALREDARDPAVREGERARLVALLGRDGELEELNHALAKAIRKGEMESGQLETHLIRTTIEKLTIDQPNYPSFKAWKGDMK